ncbi:unnamed protein product [Chondrus crispus]|uniref:Uncharacterized protein n=1 Tax=Chondrus crispus TaxID=2769 RepID=R7QIZ2_CHOCR|nr:unnamed protein product [Chondrus crispus]CDF37441.1 unnamed protein product [Chondrus crispus]|eukprot:XP_005717260.1 unnamed protein product [Chondrus crispus]
MGWYRSLHLKRLTTKNCHVASHVASNSMIAVQYCCGNSSARYRATCANENPLVFVFILHKSAALPFPICSRDGS